MKSIYRKIIRNPGRRKLARWQTALHEAGHAVAYSRLCRTWARGFVFGYAGAGGVCCHGTPCGPVESSLIATGAGDAAAVFAGWISCPAGRPRRIRGSLSTRIPSDERQAVRFIELLNREADRTDAPHISPLRVEEVAKKFVRDHLNEIIHVGETLFLTGRAYVPAPQKQQSKASARVLPGEITCIAACAAKD